MKKNKGESRSTPAENTEVLAPSSNHPVGANLDPKLIEQYKRDIEEDRQTYSADAREPVKSSSTGEEYRNAYNPNKTTDLGNAERLIALAGGDLIFAEGVGWLNYRGGRWVNDNSLPRELYKNKVIPDIYQSIAAAANAHKTSDIKELASWAKRSENPQRVDGALKMASSDPAISRRAEELDKNHYLLNVENGTIDLKAGKLKPHDKSDLITKQIDVCYDPAATCPTWQRFLKRIFNDDAELIHYLQKALGYTLTGSVKEDKWFVCYGFGANGKSTMLNTILRLLSGYATPAPQNLLTQNSRGEGAPDTTLSNLFGRRFVLSQETGEGQRLSESLVKYLSGGDKITARRLYQEPFSFDPTHKIWLATNHRPEIRDQTESTWRRLKLIPFKVVIPAEDRDPNLSEKLRAENPGILAWLVEGCLLWQREGLQDDPAAVAAATEEYRKDSDRIGQFLSEKTEPCSWDNERFSRVYDSYSIWANNAGVKRVSAIRFGKAMAEKGFEKYNGTGNQAYIRGLRLIPET